MTEVEEAERIRARCERAFVERLPTMKQLVALARTPKEKAAARRLEAKMRRALKMEHARASRPGIVEVFTLQLGGTPLRDREETKQEEYT